MTGPTLCQQIDALEFSDHASELFVMLSGIDLTDESGAVVLVAAALLLDRAYPDDTPRENDALLSLGEEFTDLIFEVRKRLRIGICRPSLRIVGGIDVE